MHNKKVCVWKERDDELRNIRCAGAINNSLKVQKLILLSFSRNDVISSEHHKTNETTIRGRKENASCVNFPSSHSLLLLPVSQWQIITLFNNNFSYSSYAAVYILSRSSSSVCLAIFLFSLSISLDEVNFELNEMCKSDVWNVFKFFINVSLVRGLYSDDNDDEK